MKVQIEKDLFLKCYLLLADEDFRSADEETYIKLLESVTEPLKAKFDAIYRRELYTKSKTAKTAEEKEQAKQKYLDEIGLYKDWRYSKLSKNT